MRAFHVEIGDRAILACPPTNMNALLKGSGAPEYVPSVDHALAKCAKCETDVWIGPRQRQARAQLGDGAVVLCMECAIQIQRERGGGIVGHLGGNDGRPRKLG
ncbi:hypothetical protein ONA70_00475 [Micromonospora yasonensis]|uniref:hypothetical protein n=1 Tax=Micromonospora yasonensis TaxID=1128667 RepID=UPI002231C951|nr:hypothetical protein [Micromonospora yasonensis]MCW3838576.1 hypothetical protein [Micromonospora yasonensis]